MTMNETWDCIVVGGGAAGLSAALVLGRARRRTLLIDAGAPANLPAHGIGGLLGHDGRPPSDLYELGRQELRKYPDVEVRNDTVVAAGRLDEASSRSRAEADAGQADGANSGFGTEGAAAAGDARDQFTVELDSGTRVAARTLILATGMRYRRPEIPGIEPLWGDSVFHCPFCHGWEARDQPLAMLGKGDKGIHGALMLRGWSEDVMLLTDGPSELSDDHRSRLARAGVAVDERQVVELAATDGRLSEIIFEGGERLERAGMMIAAQLEQTHQWVDRLGVKMRGDSPMVTGAIEVNNIQETSVPGVFAAGDVTGHSPNVVGAISSGSMAATGVVRILLAEGFGLPLH